MRSRRDARTLMPSGDDDDDHDDDEDEFATIKTPLRATWSLVVLSVSAGTAKLLISD